MKSTLYSPAQPRSFSLFLYSATLIFVIGWIYQSAAHFACNNDISGALAISTQQFTEGMFEFEITPSMQPGVVTVFGLANDGLVPEDPYF